MLLYPHTSLLRPRFRCWTTCWTLRWRTACWEEGPRTTRTTPSTSTMKNSKPKLRWGAEDWVVVWGDVCKFDLAVCCSAGHWQVCQGGWYYYAVCQEHTRCHAQYLHTGSARSEQHGSVVPFFFFFSLWIFVDVLIAFPDFSTSRSSKYAERGSTSVIVLSKSCTTGSCCGTALAPPTMRV